MTHARTHNGSDGAATPPRPAPTIVRNHRAHSEDEALKRFHAAAAKGRQAGLYPIAMSWSNGELTGRPDQVELAVTYLRRDS